MTRTTDKDCSLADARTMLVRELAQVLNRNSIESKSDTPDFVLAEYLVDCLDAWETAVTRRDKWFGADFGPPTKVVPLPSTPENVDSPRTPTP